MTTENMTTREKLIYLRDHVVPEIDESRLNFDFWMVFDHREEMVCGCLIGQLVHFNLWSELGLSFSDPDDELFDLEDFYSLEYGEMSACIQHKATSTVGNEAVRMAFGKDISHVTFAYPEKPNKQDIVNRINDLLIELSEESHE